MATIPMADVVHIGYPKAASTFIGQFLKAHPQVTTDHNCLANYLLQPRSISVPRAIAKSDLSKIHVSIDESIAESVCVVGDLEVWRRHKYIPDAWDSVKDDIIVDPVEKALRLHRILPQTKVLMLIREQVDWLQSTYKFVMSRLPPNRRSFADFCATPTGIVFLKAGHFDQTIRAYVDVFGCDRVHVLRFKDIATAPECFAAELCAFLGISERPLPQGRENSTHTQIARIQRLFPVIERLPRNMKTALKRNAMRLIPGGRKSILSTQDVQLLRDMYTASNQRTDKLISQLCATAIGVRSKAHISTVQGMRP
jgi:sulfotransferase family protein